MRITVFVCVCQVLFISPCEGATNITTKCGNGLCLTLYKSDVSGGVTWNESVSQCQKFNMELASIPDYTAYLTLADLIAQAVSSDNTIDGVWIAGTFTYTDWTFFDGSPGPGSPISRKESNDYCAYVEIGPTESSTVTFTTDQCTEEFGDSRPLCETKNPCASPDNMTKFTFNDKCYTYVPGGIRDRVNWYAAQVQCSNIGDLAYSDIQDENFQKMLRNADIEQVWIWLNEYQWEWREPDGRYTPIRYFRWDSHHTDTSSNTRMYVTDQAVFSSAGASDRKQYFLGTDRTITTKTTGSGSTDDETTGTTASSIPKDTSTSDSPNESEFPIEIAAGAAGGGAVLVALIVVIVVVVLKKKRKKRNDAKDTSNIYANEEVIASSNAFDSPARRVDYEEVTAGDGAYAAIQDNKDQEPRVSMINPYGEFSPEANATTAATETETGGNTGPAIYAMPSKPNKQAIVQPKVGDVKDKRKPSVRAQKPKLLDRIKKPSFRSPKPSNLASTSKQVGKMEIIHQEAPGGDIYALSMKSPEVQNQSSDVLGML